MDKPINETDYSFFTIHQAAHACGISRSSLIRLEEKGLLVPARTNPASGYRYYDNNNITRILQIQKFQYMGFSTEEIGAYYASGGMAHDLLVVLEQKLSLLQQQVSEMRLRSHAAPDKSASIIKIPETVCCMHRFQGSSVQDKYVAMYEFFHECVEKGYVLSSEPLSIINERTDYLEGQISSAPYDSYICIPVLPKRAPEDAVRIPAYTALSVLFYGNYDRADDAYLYLGEQVRERGLTPAGYVRSIALVAPYTSLEFDPGRYCSQLVLPIENI